MRQMVERLSTPRPRSPHMNNEEPINLSHYPDGRAPEENADREAPIERDDFPAPPFAYSRRRRHMSEPGSSRAESSRESTPVVSSSSEDEDEPFVDEKLDKTESELKKFGDTSMGKVFLAEIAVERERRKQAKHKYVDPRSAARTPAANKIPHYRLRYDCPVNASPSRIADHLKPWDDWDDGGTSVSRRSNVTTPFLPQTPHPQRPVVSPVNPIRPGYTQKSQTLPARFSPGGGGTSTEFSSKSDVGEVPPMTNGQNIRVSSTYTQGLQAATPRSQPSPQHRESDDDVDGMTNGDLNRSLPNMGGPLQAPNIYPLHLLFTTNYRLPGDVDRCNLEKHLSDADFDMVFRCRREDFYMMPYWKRCELKRKYHLF